MFKEGSEPHSPREASEDSNSEVAPGVFDMSGLMEQELAKEDPIFAETLAEIEKAENPRLRKLLESIKERMLNEYLDSKYKVDEHSTRTLN